MQVLTAAETFAAIEKATAPLLRRLDIAEAIIKENGYLVDASEAREMTGIKDNRTLKDRFTPVIDGGKLKFSKAEIIAWKMAQSLPKSQPLKITA